MSDLELHELDVEECLQLLARRRFGRLAVDDDHGPVILPVNYRLQDGMILIRTATGTKLDAADRQAAATLEVDDVADDGDAGWSLVVRGRLRRLMGTSRGSAQEPVPVPDGDRPHLIGLMPGRITGRRFGSEEARYRRRVPATSGNVWRGRDGDDLLG